MHTSTEYCLEAVKERHMDRPSCTLPLSTVSRLLRNATWTDSHAQLYTQYILRNLSGWRRCRERQRVDGAHLSVAALHRFYVNFLKAWPCVALSLSLSIYPVTRASIALYIPCHQSVHSALHTQSPERP